MSKSPIPLLVLSATIATSMMANPEVDPVGGRDVKRDDPKIAKALREPLALGPLAEAFKEALHTEEVIRDLEAASAEYAAIVKKFRAKETGGFGAGVASLSLFRLAEIRRKQGREDEARKHYTEVTEEFADWEPMASLARQQLGLDPSDFLPMLAQLERRRALSKHVERSLWKIRTRVCDDKFVLVTFKVEPDEESMVKGLPQASEIQTLHYRPNGPLTGFVSTTRVEGDALGKGRILVSSVRETLVTRLTGFGLSYDVPAGLRQNSATTVAMSDWIGMRAFPYDVKAFWSFEDDRGEGRSALTVGFTLATISEAKARELAASSAIGLLKLGDQPWSLTLPPSPAELANDQEDK